MACRRRQIISITVVHRCDAQRFVGMTERKGMIYEYRAQKVAEPAARHGRVDNRTGYLYPAVVYRDAELPFRTLLFARSKEFSLESFAFIFTDPDFYKALKSGFILAFGLVIIAIPLGGILAFLMVRTDLPGRRLIEPLILVPIFVSPMVLGFGYVVAAGPVGFFSQWAEALIGFVPWNIYSMSSIVVIAGLTHVPHAYLYISSALRSVGSDVEEAARTAGASPLQVMTAVSLPMVRPSILYASVLLFFLGLEVFGLMLVLGDPEGNLVLATYLYKLTNKLGTPSYHLMAAVAVVLICITIPLVMLQRRLMRTANRFVTMKGKASQARALPLGKWRWVAGAVVVSSGSPSPSACH